MQGWLFESDPGFWTKERAKALVTSVPQVTSTFIIMVVLQTVSEMILRLYR